MKSLFEKIEVERKVMGEVNNCRMMSKGVKGVIDT